jgi:chromosome partitioning protein
MSAKIISFMNRKGGVGKSTLCSLIAISLFMRKKYKVLLIDADEQLSIYKQRLEEASEGAVSYDILPFRWERQDKKDNPIERFCSLIEEKEGLYDVILIDTQGRLEGEGVPSVITVSDVLIVPLIASKKDIDSTIAFLEKVPPIVERKKQQGYDLKLLGVVNKNDGSLEYNELYQFQGLYGMDLFKNDISYLVRYKRVISTISDFIPAKKQKDEYNVFFKEFTYKCGL